jgi:hypothetical protein
MSGAGMSAKREPLDRKREPDVEAAALREAVSRADDRLRRTDGNVLLAIYDALAILGDALDGADE